MEDSSLGQTSQWRFKARIICATKIRMIINNAVIELNDVVWKRICLYSLYDIIAGEPIFLLFIY